MLSFLFFGSGFMDLEMKLQQANMYIIIHFYLSLRKLGFERHGQKQKIFPSKYMEQQQDQCG